MECGAVRNGDTIMPHSCEDCGSNCDETCPPHTGLYLGSRSVYANGRPIQAIGDLVSCTSTAIVGSANVIV